MLVTMVLCPFSFMKGESEDITTSPSLVPSLKTFKVVESVVKFRRFSPVMVSCTSPTLRGTSSTFRSSK